MNAIGGGNGINIIRMRHNGADFNYVRMGSQRRPEMVEVKVKKDNSITLEFQDLYEVDSLISALEDFKKECQIYTGSWRRV